MILDPLDHEISDRELSRFETIRGVYCHGVEWGLFCARLETGFAFSMRISASTLLRIKSVLMGRQYRRAFVVSGREVLCLPSGCRVEVFEVKIAAEEP